MEYQKRINLLDNTSNHSSKFRKKNYIEINQEEHTMLIAKTILKLQC